MLAQGGTKNCALCSSVKGGALPCHKVPPSKNPNNKGDKKYSACTDDKMMINRKWFRAFNGGWCAGLDSRAALQGTAFTYYRFPTTGRSLVLSKVFVTHPHKADRKVGTVMFKRLVTHTCTGSTSACKKGTTVADVFKVGVCVKCNYNVFPSIQAGYANDHHKKSFVNTCLPKAIDAKGAVKRGFRCTGNDKKYSDASVAGF